MPAIFIMRTPACLWLMMVCAIQFLTKANTDNIKGSGAESSKNWVKDACTLHPLVLFCICLEVSGWFPDEKYARFTTTIHHCTVQPIRLRRRYKIVKYICIPIHTIKATPTFANIDNQNVFGAPSFCLLGSIRSVYTQ